MKVFVVVVCALLAVVNGNNGYGGSPYVINYESAHNGYGSPQAHVINYESANNNGNQVLSLQPTGGNPSVGNNNQYNSGAVSYSSPAQSYQAAPASYSSPVPTYQAAPVSYSSPAPAQTYQAAGNPSASNTQYGSSGGAVAYSSPGHAYQAAPVTYAAPTITFYPPTLHYNGQSVTYASSSSNGYDGTQSYQPANSYSAPATPTVQNYKPSYKK